MSESTRIFISWSGVRSKAIANQLHTYLRHISHSIEPWVSDIDIAAGEPWWLAVDSALALSTIGLVCVTADNVTSPWLLYEAGALVRGVPSGGRRLLVPLLFDITPAALPAPLRPFQVETLDSAGWGRLVRRICELSGDKRDRLETDRLSDALWPQLLSSLDKIREQFPRPEHTADPLAGVWVDSFRAQDNTLHVAVVHITVNESRVTITGTEYDEQLSERVNWISTAASRDGEQHLHYVYRSSLHTLEPPFKGMTELAFSYPGYSAHAGSFTEYRGHFVNVKRDNLGEITLEQGLLHGRRVDEAILARRGITERKIAEWHLNSLRKQPKASSR